MNKNISIWRGSDPPPTNYHIWVKSDNSVNLFVKDEWKIIIDPKAYENLVKYIDEQINLLKSGADIDFDTLKEIADWIKQHEEDYMLVLPQLQSQLEVLQSNINKKLDLIEDLDTIRKGAEKGTTSIQEIKTINGQSLVGSGNINIEDYLNDTVKLSTDLTIAGAKTFTKKVIAPSFIVPSGTADQFLKADGSLDNKVYLNTENYKSYAPSLTGEGATGTWNININGKASSVEWNNVTLHPTKLSEFTDDVVEGNYLPMAESTYDTTDAINVLKHDGSWGIPEFSSNLYGLGESSSQTAIMLPTAGELSIDDGIATVNNIKGNTIVWNQRFKDTKTLFASNGISVEILNGVTSLNGTINTTYMNIVKMSSNNDTTIPINHIGCYKCTIVKDLNNILQNKEFALHNRISGGKIIGSTASFIYKNTDDSLGWSFGFSGFTTGDVLEDVQIKVNIFDLTQMFGEGNEPTIEEFEAMFPNDYYEYNEGELRSIEDFSIKSVGFNAWDEEWVLGSGANGDINYDSTLSVVPKNHIKVIPNATYYIEAPNYLYLYGYNADKIKIQNSYLAIRKGLFTIPNNVFYLKFQMQDTYGKQYNNDICINLSHSGIRDGEYEPYQEDILPINISTIKDENEEQLFPNGLCSAGEAHDELVYDKGIGKWKAVKRIGSVDMGTLKWNKYDISDNRPLGFFLGNNYNCPTMTLIKTNTIKCVKYEYKYSWRIDKIIMKYTSIRAGIAVCVIDTSYTDLDSFKQSLQGQILYYELAEPIEVVLDNVNLFYKAWDWGTEERISDKMLIPFTMDITYNPNVVKLIKSLQLTITMIQEDLQNVGNQIQTAILSAITTTLNTNI